MVARSGNFSTTLERKKAQARTKTRARIQACVQKNEYKKVASVKELQSSIQTRRFLLTLAVFIMLGIGLWSIFS